MVQDLNMRKAESNDIGHLDGQDDEECRDEEQVDIFSTTDLTSINSSSSNSSDNRKSTIATATSSSKWDKYL